MDALENPGRTPKATGTLAMTSFRHRAGNGLPLRVCNGPSCRDSLGLYVAYKSAVTGERTNHPGSNFLGTASVHWSYGDVSDPVASFEMGHFRTASMKYRDGAAAPYTFDALNAPPAVVEADGHILMAASQQSGDAVDNQVLLLPRADGFDERTELPLWDRNDWAAIASWFVNGTGSDSADDGAEVEPCR